MKSSEFEVQEISLYHKPDWFLDGIQIRRELTEWSFLPEVTQGATLLPEPARKKPTSEQFFYWYENEHLVGINGINQITNSTASLLVEWTGNNVNRFTGTDGPTMTCTYNIGLTSSCKMGKGNTILLFQPVDANIAISFSEDHLQSIRSINLNWTLILYLQAYMFCQY